jgi:hypothetical protein
MTQRLVGTTALATRAHISIGHAVANRFSA